MGDFECYFLILCFSSPPREEMSSFLFVTCLVKGGFLDFSEGSVMERHHFAQSMCILNTEGCNILENITKQVITIYLKGLSRELD